jgi:hypothetical protein
MHRRGGRDDPRISLAWPVLCVRSTYTSSERSIVVICSKCGDDLAETAFELRSDTGRRRSYCRECRRLQWRQQNDSDRHRASCRIYYHRTHARGTPKGSQGDPELRKALSRLYHQIRRGTIQKPDHCQICGMRPPRRFIQAHLRQHDVKSDPVWCCQLCNRAIERCEVKADA